LLLVDVPPIKHMPEVESPRTEAAVLDRVPF
jgi:hypothetical protein